MSPTRRLWNLTLFFATSALCGVLVAGLVLPPLLLGAVTIRAVAEQSTQLAEDLATPQPAGRTRLLMADGTHLAWLYDLNRQPVALDQVSPWMVKAQLAAENHRFYDQGPIDPMGIARATLGNITTDGQAGGGSGITQQYVKMLLVEQALLDDNKAGIQAAQERSITRKVRELRYAIGVEQKLTKDQILTGYLNLAYYGDGAYGVEAAAQHYFGTTAKKLTLAQAALLAGIVKSPTAYNPVTHPTAALQRRNTVLARMQAVGLATPKQVAHARKEPFRPQTVTSVRSGCTGTRNPFICDAARRELLTWPALGPDEQARRNTLHRDGLTIRLTTDPELQDQTQQAISDTIAPADPAIAVMSTVQPGTGRVLAMAQSRPQMGSKKGQTWYNHPLPLADGGAEGYQAGSTFKTFTMAAAFDQGLTSHLTYDSPASINLSGMTFDTCNGPFTFTGNHTVWNLADQKFGRIPMTTAAQKSVNSYFIQLEQAVGLCRLAHTADAAGITRADGKP
ncbi:transglycosylase domain-containing protein [Luteococcus sp. Sow4_B9]|uniref:transglycosylase domain-containing protein n=1 Tax=Luteococcus sp. Sow4_B9 TaxID=3438792 RepID=UPI003F97691A